MDTYNAAATDISVSLGSAVKVGQNSLDLMTPIEGRGHLRRVDDLEAEVHHGGQIGFASCGSATGPAAGGELPSSKGEVAGLRAVVRK